MVTHLLCSQCGEVQSRYGLFPLNPIRYSIIIYSSKMTLPPSHTHTHTRIWMESAIYTHLHNTSSRISSIFHTTDSAHCLIYTSTHLFNAPSICTPPMYISSLCLYPPSHLHTSVIHTVIDFIECTTYHGWRHTNEINFEKKEDCTILLKAESL